MSAYDEFAESFLKALYLETEKSGQEYHSAQKLTDTYGLTPKPHWISRIADDWEFSFFRDVSKVLGGYGDWSFRISAAGAKKVEEALEANEIVAAVFAPGLQSARISDVAKAEVIPASDRVVPLDHNSSQYRDVKDGLDALLAEARGNNEFGQTPEERDRIVRSLEAASDLWRALELKIVQIRVGVLLAIEDAGQALKKVGKDTACSLLVDLLKRLVKDKIGIEL